MGCSPVHLIKMRLQGAAILLIGCLMMGSPIPGGAAPKRKPSNLPVPARKNPVGGLAAGDYHITLKHDGQDREMLIRVPRRYDPGRKYPVIFGFHGAKGPMQGYHRQLQFLVEKEGVISVSPQGLTGRNRDVTMWNGFPGHRVGNVDDVGLVRKTVAYLDQKASIDKQKIFATGGSSGAILCFRLALETDLFAGIAPMRGGMSDRLPVPRGRPRLSILLVCGGEDSLFIDGRSRGEGFRSARKTMTLWAANHGASGGATKIRETNELLLTRFGKRNADYELQLYVVKGEGHALKPPIMRQALTHMWEVFSQSNGHR